MHRHQIKFFLSKPLLSSDLILSLITSADSLSRLESLLKIITYQIKNIIKNIDNY